jgi:hypothetical protein
MNGGATRSQGASIAHAGSVARSIGARAVRPHNNGRSRSGDIRLARRIFRLVTLVMLFLLGVITGMLLPPSWLIGHQ